MWNFFKARILGYGGVTPRGLYKNGYIGFSIYLSSQNLKNMTCNKIMSSNKVMLKIV